MINKKANLNLIAIILLFIFIALVVGRIIGLW